MEKMTAQDGISLDIVNENLKSLKAIFPEAFTDDGVDFDVLRQLLGGEVDDGEEKYGLTWHGKKKARQIALTPSLGTLRPCPEESVDWDTTQNLFIEGDNLEVLKLLQKSYANKVKLIYIDPPYNTEGDFIYSDRYQDNLNTYLRNTGQIDDEGTRLTSTTEVSGRKHTNWLNMMLPRLELARNLLSDEGLIVSHIDEHEFSNLVALMDEVFGPENNLGPIVWDKRNPKGDATKIATQHEYLVVYAKHADVLKESHPLKRPKENAERMLAKAKTIFSKMGGQHVPSGLENAVKKYAIALALDGYRRPYALDEINEEYKEWLKDQDVSGGEAAYNLIDENGEICQSVSMAWPNKQQAPEEYWEPLIHPSTGKPCPLPARGWRNPPSTMKELLDKGLIIFGIDETKQPRRKYFLSENMDENIPSIIPFGGSDDALLKELGIPFDNPKPLKFAKNILKYFLGEHGIVIDFFAGSGTTAHACYDLNLDQNAQHRHIMVQLPEQLDANKREQKTAFKFCQDNGLPTNIAEIAKERIRRAAVKIKEENPEYDGDLGFKVFKLDSSNIRTWNPDRYDLEQTLLDHTDYLVAGRSEEDILYELLLKRGVDLTVPIEEKSIVGKTVYSIGYGVLFACLETAISRDEVEDLAIGIIGWHKELEPASDTQVVFRDSAFANEIAKTNITAILEQHGIAHVRSL